ncbi:MAG: efflux RND transporter periplasmic adaptor subunit [Nitrosomonadaceae bacterium]|nr:efflux RND transporter periplasmic adaptor subunit [Nitrosomonadaceae bacterium]
MKSIVLNTGAIVFISLFIVGCNDSEPLSLPEEQRVSVPNKDIYSIQLKPGMTKHLKIGLPVSLELADKLRVPGRIEPDEETLVRIGANVTGRIVEVNSRLGDEVISGTVLAKISSPEFTEAQLAFLRANSQTTLAERASERATQLLLADVIGSAELQRRESELQVFRAEQSAAKDQLRLLGIGSKALSSLGKLGRILPSVEISSPIEGTVIERKVSVGQVVEPSDQLYSIADLSSVWVVGDVPEQSARGVKIDQHVEVYIPALGDVRLIGRIVFVADTVDPETRTVMVRTLVDNERRNLKPAMLARMYITGVQNKKLVIPEGAVVREDNRDHVFIAQGNDHFLLVPVELGEAVGQVRPVLEGLDKNREIVLDGAFHLNNERKRADLE